MVRSSLPAANVVAVARQRVGAIDAALPVNNPQTLAQLASEVVSQPRFRMVLLGIFAALALTLAAVGVFGVLSYFRDRAVAGDWRPHRPGRPTFGRRRHTSRSPRRLRSE